MDQKVLKTGNSLAVTIPSDFVKVNGIRPGVNVTAHIDQVHGRIVYTFPSSGQMSLLSTHKS